MKLAGIAPSGVIHPWAGPCLRAVPRRASLGKGAELAGGVGASTLSLLISFIFFF